MYIEHETGQIVHEMIRRRAYWVTVNLTAVNLWPTEDTLVHYEGRQMLLLTPGDNTAPCIAVSSNGGMEQDDIRFIRRFLGAFVWIKGGALREGRTYFGNRIIRSGLDSHGGIIKDSNFRLYYLPQYHTNEARLCLALFREGKSIGHVAYQFLSFFKVINFHHDSGSKQKTWIQFCLATLTSTKAKERYNELLLDHGSDKKVAQYLYESGRCAVAHAGVSPMVDPDDPEDSKRLTLDLPLIQALAEHIIAETYDLITPDKLHREANYRFAYLKERFGPDHTRTLTSGNFVSRRELDFPDHIDLGMLTKTQLVSFKRMRSRLQVTGDGKLKLELRSHCGSFKFPLVLDLKHNLFEYDLNNGIPHNDNGSSDAVRVAIDLHQFEFELLCNGELTLRDSENGKLLAIADALIPVNCFVDPDSYDAHQEHLEKVLTERQAAEVGADDMK